MESINLASIESALERLVIAEAYHQLESINFAKRLRIDLDPQTVSAVEDHLRTTLAEFAPTELRDLQRSKAATRMALTAQGSDSYEVDRLLQPPRAAATGAFASDLIPVLLGSSMAAAILSSVWQSLKQRLRPTLTTQQVIISHSIAEAVRQGARSVRLALPADETFLDQIKTQCADIGVSQTCETQADGHICLEIHFDPPLPEITYQPPPYPGEGWDYFISYASQDWPIVADILREVRSCNKTYWIDREQISIGGWIVPLIECGLDHSKQILICLSRNQLRSGWCRAEYTAVLTKLLAGLSEQKAICMVLDDMDDAEIPTLLQPYRRLHWQSVSADWLDS